MPKNCTCGCGNPIKIKPYHKYKSKGIPNYIKGHNTQKWQFKQGQKHSKKHIEKMKNSYYHTHLEGKNNPFYGKHHTKESKGKIKQRIYPYGKNHPMFGKKCQNSKGAYYKNIWLRSSYEIAYAKWLDKNQIKWTYEPIAFNLGNNTYRPDFYLPQTNEYIEIKGFWRLKAKEKYTLFKKLYPKIKIIVLTKDILIQKGVL